MKQFLLTLTNIIKVSLMFVKQFYSNTICFFNGDLMRAISGLIAVELLLATPQGCYLLQQFPMV